VERIRAARLRDGAPAAPPRPVPLPTPARPDATLDAVVSRRSSTRRFVERPITAGELSAVLALPAHGPPADFLRAQPTLLETYVIVNAVDGIPSGAYHFRADAQQLEVLRTGDFRDTAGFLCLDQALAHDASAVLFYLADLDRVRTAFGERGDRLAELEAGLVAGRAYLAAYAAGRGATGLTFYDDEVTRFFSPHAAGRAPLLVVAVGEPARRPSGRAGRRLRAVGETAQKARGLRNSGFRGAYAEDGHAPGTRAARERSVGSAERATFTLGQREVDAVRQLVTQLEREEERGVDQLLVRDQLDHPVAGGVQQSPQTRGRARRAELPLHDLPTQRCGGLDQHQAGCDPADRPREERGGRVAVGLVDHPLDRHGRVDDGEARRLSPTHPGPCV